MTRLQFLKPIVRVFVASTVLTIVFAAGVAAGLHFYPQLFAATDNDHGHDDHAHRHEDHGPLDGATTEHDHMAEEHVALTEQAFGNLQLAMGHASMGDYWKSMLVPAQVVEIPGRSDLSVSAPVAGIVERVFVVPGQTLRPKQPLFEIQLTDQSLTDAQSQLLAAITRQEVARAEIARLTPLAQSGVIAGTNKRKLEYELRQLEAAQATLTQQLHGRGFPKAMIAKVLEEKQLATSMLVYAPDYVMDTPESTTGYSIENLSVHPGKSVVRGADLCNVAYHSQLYIEGTAFEDDLSKLNAIVENDWSISVELHQVHGGRTRRVELDSVKLLRIDNHVDEKTQAVHFYSQLQNTVVRTQKDGESLFEQWRFRPGQRLHLRLPIERWTNQITVPVESVVIDGPNVLVFAEHHHDGKPLLDGEQALNDEVACDASRIDADADKDHVDDHDDDVFIELEPVPVRLLHRDDQTVVIANDGQIARHREIALNNAQKLYLAMKMQVGGGGHHHHHDH